MNSLLLRHHTFVPSPRFVWCRRMRILTAAMPLAATPQQALRACDAEATLCLVVHKVRGRR